MPEDADNTGKKGKEGFGGVRLVFSSKGENDPFEELFGRSRAGGERREEGQAGPEEEEAGKSDLQKQIEAILAAVNAVGETEGGEEKIRALIEVLYAGLTQQYRPAIKIILPIIGELIGKDINLALLPLLKFANEVGESPEVQTERQRGRRARAKTRKAIYQAYLEEGFSPDQAMALLMNDIARSGSLNTIQAASAVLKTTPTGIKKAAKEGLKTGIQRAKRKP